MLALVGVCGSTTKEKASSSAGFRYSSSAGWRATDTVLQLKFISSVCLPALLLYVLSSSAFGAQRYW